jgi:hypothetical protein
MVDGKTEPRPRRQVMTHDNTFIGMDVHKNSTEIAIAQAGRDGKVRHYWAHRRELVSAG